MHLVRRYARPDDREIVGRRRVGVVPRREHGKRTLDIRKGTQYGDLFRLQGAGLPNLRNGQRGDLVVVVKIETPKKLSAQQEQLLREYAATEDKNVNPESAGFWKKITDRLGG